MTSAVATTTARAQQITTTNPPGAGTAVPSADIFEAAFWGDAKRITELAKQNPAIARLRSADGRTPLHYAIAGGQPQLILQISALGADLSAGPESPLLGAVDYPEHAKASEMAHMLLMNASDPNARRKDGQTALQIATARGYTDIVEMLIHRGADFPGRTNIERVYFGQRYTYDASGRPFTAPDLDGLPQYFINEFISLSHANPERVKHLFKLAPSLAMARATWDEMAIEAASHMGLVALAQFLADQGSPVSVCTAALIGRKDRVEALVKSDPQCVRERGAHDIGLMAYTAYGDQQAEIADFLIRAGANLRASALGVTALHLAASKGYVELASVLIEGGADVNAAGKSRGIVITPLAMAARAKQSRMEQFLRERGAQMEPDSGTKTGSF